MEKLGTRNVRRSLFVVALCGGLFVVALGVSAQRGEGPPGGHRGPPAEALAACEGRSDGDACSVETPDGTRSGTCHAPPGRALVCMPAGGGPGGHHGPPPGAIEACRDTDAGDACVMDTPDGTLEGTCEESPAGIACRPVRPPSRGDRGA